MATKQQKDNKQLLEGLKPIRFPVLYLLFLHPITAMKLVASKVVSFEINPSYESKSKRAEKEMKILYGAFGASSTSSIASNLANNVIDRKQILSSTMDQKTSLSEQKKSYESSDPQQIKDSQNTIKKEETSHRLKR